MTGPPVAVSGEPALLGEHWRGSDDRLPGGMPDRAGCAGDRLLSAACRYQLTQLITGHDDAIGASLPRPDNIHDRVVAGLIDADDTSCPVTTPVPQGRTDQVMYPLNTLFVCCFLHEPSLDGHRTGSR